MRDRILSIGKSAWRNTSVTFGKVLVWIKEPTRVSSRRVRSYWETAAEVLSAIPNITTVPPGGTILSAVRAGYRG